MSEEQPFGQKMSIGKVSTTNEWMIKISMEVHQMNAEIVSLKSSIDRDANTLSDIKADLQLLKTNKNRIDELEDDQKEMEKRVSKMSGEFRVVSTILFLALTALFGWVFTKTPAERQQQPIIIKIDRDMLKAKALKK